jgi:CRP/FNR family transcriptional regulator, anaerobic regulatory protein
MATEQPHSPTDKNANCSLCLLYKANLCAAVLDKSAARAASNVVLPRIDITKHTIAARQMIHHPREFSEYVLFLCLGQAVSSIGLADGRRQILSILLPGDVILWTALFESTPGRIVEAIQDTTYRKLKRSQFHAMLFAHPDLFAMFQESCSQEKTQTDQIMLSLGRRPASARIARLILGLWDRLNERGLNGEPTMDFHLRLRHIADATGLTPVHVSKVLRMFRQAGLLKLQKRALTILDPKQLRLAAGP